MARHVGRSRGCKYCLQRRIKCDENLPECTQCVSHGQKCPGPTVGAVFVTMKPKARKKSGVEENSDSNAQKVPSILLGDVQNGYMRGASRVVDPDPPRGRKQPIGLSNEFLLPSSYQPSRTAAFEQLFLGHFISSFDNRNLHRTPMKSWYQQLPAILDTSPCEAVQASIRASMMVHYGVVTTDASIRTEAYRCYAKALKCQRTFLQKNRSALSSKMPTGEEILSSVILSIFELVSSTTPTGWIEHLLGAASMLQMRKPENCQDGLAHLVFRTMRMTIVYITMTTEEQHVFATDPWTTVPFEVQPKTIYDKLIDILLLIPGCLSLQTKIKRMPGVDTPEKEMLLVELELMASSQLHCLHNWWQEYAEDVAKRSGKHPSLLYGLGGAKLPSRSKEPYFLDAFTAACTASCHAANVILYALLSFTSSEPHAYEPEVESHINLILTSALYLVKNGSCSAGTLMMVFPLKIICRCALNEVQRQSAFEILQIWGQNKGIEGICTQAAPQFEIPIISELRGLSPISDYLYGQ